MDKEREVHKGNGREKEIQQVAQEDTVLSEVVESWKLKKSVDIMMADRLVNMWRKIKKMEAKVEEQGYVLGVGQILAPHPLLSKIKDQEALMLSFYKTFSEQNKIPPGEAKDFAGFLEDVGKKK